MTTAKIIVLAIHNLLRWAILIMAIYALYNTIRGWIKKSAWTQTAQKSLAFFSISLDIQLLTGLMLYFIFSDLTKAAFADFSGMMSNPIIRFFTLEHSLLMILAVVGGHLASAAGKKELPDLQKFRRTTFLLAITLFAILTAIPWTTRPLLPGL